MYGKKFILGNIVSTLEINKKQLSFSTFICPTYTFSMAGTIIVYTPSQGTVGEKYLNY